MINIVIGYDICNCWLPEPPVYYFMLECKYLQCYSLVETLLRRSSYKQQQFVRTVVQPALHRDFMYTASKHYPSRKFVPISTTTSRDKKV